MMAPEQPVIVVVPVYRERLDETERRSLQRLRQVLPRHPKVFVAPRSLAPAALAGMAPEFGIERFDDAFFAGVAGYNRLMLWPDFYRRFGGYRHLLVHQLDAYLFRDELDQWCALDYDYIGAPWIRPELLQRPEWLCWRAWRGRLARRHAVSARWRRWARFGQVGNGGLSLRKVGACLRLLEATSVRLEPFRQAATEHFHEDMFFGLEGREARPPLSRPDWPQALGFAVEGWPREALVYRQGRLPFGCHGWPKVDPMFWRAILDEAEAASRGDDAGRPPPEDAHAARPP